MDQTNLIDEKKQLELTMSNTLQQTDNTTIRLSVLVALVT